MTKEADFDLLAAQVRALAEEGGHWLPVLANASALIMDALPQLNWAGFYLASQGEGNRRSLVLGPFQGKVACTRIAWGRGVCGTAAERDEPQLVADVHAFPGHIACDSASASEVVLPLHDGSGSVVGVLDVDSPVQGRFDESDLAGLGLVANVIEGCCGFDGPPL